MGGKGKKEKGVPYDPYQVKPMNSLKKQDDSLNQPQDQSDKQNKRLVYQQKNTNKNVVVEERKQIWQGDDDPFALLEIDKDVKNKKLKKNQKQNDQIQQQGWNPKTAASVPNDISSIPIKIVQGRPRFDKDNNNQQNQRQVYQEKSQNQPIQMYQKKNDQVQNQKKNEQSSEDELPKKSQKIDQIASDNDDSNSQNEIINYQPNIGRKKFGIKNQKQAEEISEEESKQIKQKHNDFDSVPKQKQEIQNEDDSDDDGFVIGTINKLPQNNQISQIGQIQISDQKQEKNDESSDDDGFYIGTANKNIPQVAQSLIQNDYIQFEEEEKNQIGQEKKEFKKVIRNEEGDLEDENGEKVFAIIDDMDVSNFDELLPEDERAIVYPFDLDTFQKRAVYRLEKGQCVFVAAHTSAGKTVVAEYAIALSFKHQTKTIFTSPIKALSNQKFRDFKLKFQDVGIVTGDVTINKDATCVIMTTEVLQKQVYNDSDKLQQVEWVIFDEVHYIDDADRGSVWEEVIMKLPDHIGIVMLSATVGNYMEFAEWVGRTKGKTVYVQCTYQRPVPLEHFMIFKQKLSLIKSGEQQLDTQVTKDILIKSSEEKKKQAIKEKQNDSEKNKKIDYKGKQIANQQQANQKQISNSSNPQGQGPNSSKERKFDAFFKNLKHIQKENLLPCIVFFFSRAQVEALAHDVDKKWNFIGDSERKQIKDFVKKSLSRLEDDDRELPQVKSLVDLLYRGIGFHHAGMIPILKEMVEILFTDGLLQVVFATSTFAIGLNMPAKSVIFTQSKKFNGTTSTILSATEYLQMAGRAGRRGKDDKGASILCVDHNFGKIPHSEEYQEMFDNKGKDLESKLKLTYNTNLNILNQDGQDIDSLIKNSFFSDANEKRKIQALKTKTLIIPRIQHIQNVICDFEEPDSIKDFDFLLNEIRNFNYEIQEESKLTPIVCHICKILSPLHIMKNVIILRKIPQVKSEKRQIDRYLCLLIEEAQNGKEGFKPIVQYEDEISFEDLEQRVIQQDEKGNCIETGHSFERMKKLSKQGNLKLSGYIKGYRYQYIECKYNDIVVHYKNTIQTEKKLELGNNEILTGKQLQVFIEQYDEILKGKGLEIIKPNKGKETKMMNASRDNLIEQLQINKCFGCKKLQYHLTQLQRVKQLKHELDECNQLLKNDSNEKANDFDAKNKVLMEYNFIDKDQNILYKGKVARLVSSQDPILLTQLLFSGKLKELSNEEMLALFSVLVDQVKPSNAHEMLVSRISDKFYDTCLWLEKECEQLIETEKKCGVIDQIQEIDKRLNYFFYEIVYDWAKKKSFYSIKEQFPGLEEGICLRAIMAVDNMCKVAKEMSTLIGDSQLAARMDEAAELLKRPILSTQSLYFE